MTVVRFWHFSYQFHLKAFILWLLQNSLLIFDVRPPGVVFGSVVARRPRGIGKRHGMRLRAQCCAVRAWRRWRRRTVWKDFRPTSYPLWHESRWRRAGISDQCIATGDVRVGPASGWGAPMFFLISFRKSISFKYGDCWLLISIINSRCGL